MSSSLTLVAGPALALPAGAMFHPKMLTIGDSTNHVEYQQLCAGLSKIDDAGKIWICDATLWGMRRWGQDEGLRLAHESTKYTKCTLKKLAYIAERFTPEHRPDGFTRAHFKALLPFPQDWLNSWLLTIATERLSAKGIRALAVEQFGSDPSQRPIRKTRSVKIRAELYARLAQHSPTRKVVVLVEQILEDWLRRVIDKQPLTDAEKQRRYRERHPEERAASQKAWREKQGKPAATTYHDDKQHSTGKASVPDCPTAGNEPDATQPSPKKSGGQKKQFRSFAEAREYVRAQHLSSMSAWQKWGASRPADIPSAPWSVYSAEWISLADWLGKTAQPKVEKSRKKKPCTCKISSAYITCKTGKTLSKHMKPTSFRSREAAEEGNREFAACHGYFERVVECEICRAWHLQHAFSGESRASQSSVTLQT